jgi:mono/diheme cytochrome c family protein
MCAQVLRGALRTRAGAAAARATAAVAWLLAAGVCTLSVPGAAARAPGAQVPESNVPDVITRASGLRVTPMPRVAQLYARNCQGCHGHLGVSVAEIPRLSERIGYFARIPEGRRYLVQVPNVAMNPSSDEDIAELLNWVLDTYSRAQLPAHFRPYTAQEVGRLRKARIDVSATRQRVIERLVALKLLPSADVLAIPTSIR